MKKILSLTFILTLLFIFLSTFTYADRNVSTIKGYSASTLIKTGDWKLYRITFVATSTNGSFAIYDTAVLASGTDTNVKAEGSEATSLNGKIYDFTGKPIEGSTGLYIVIKTGYAIVSYE